MPGKVHAENRGRSHRVNRDLPPRASSVQIEYMGAVVCLRLGVAIAVLTAGTARAQSGAPERAQPHEMRDREHDEGRQIGVVGEVKRVDRATGRTWIAVHGEEFSFDLP